MVRRTIPAVVALAAVSAVIASSCTRPENETSVDVSIAPITDTSETGDTDGSGDASEPTEGSQTTDDGESPDDTSPSIAATSTTTVGSTVADSATTTTGDTGPTTTSPTSPTAAPPPDDPSDLILIFDGILPFPFGARDVDIVPALTNLLGPPTQDVLTEYPTAEQGVFLDAAAEKSFVAGFGRTVCYANDLCVQFGAGAPETLIFTGWRVDGPSSGLATEDGLSIGSTLEDFADLITFDPALSCSEIVDGSAAGIDVTLVSDDGAFATPATDGEGLELGDPDPAAVTVVEMRAGQLPVSVLADC